MKIHLIRHAHAGSRSAWDKADHKRPLSPRGEGQAKAVAAALADAGIDELWSSPSLRCRQTLVPLAEATGLSGASTIRRVKELASQVSDTCDGIAAQMVETGGDPTGVLKRMTHEIKKRSRRIRRQL